jgi:hypothetical protein
MRALKKVASKRIEFSRTRPVKRTFALVLAICASPIYATEMGWQIGVSEQSA